MMKKLLFTAFVVTIVVVVVAVDVVFVLGLSMKSLKATFCEYNNWPSQFSI